MHSKHTFNLIAAGASARSAAAHEVIYHGDLRKGAYLKRRAAYQMQASEAASVLPGSKPKREKPNS